MEGEKITIGVKTLLGNPKKAIIKLSIPMTIGMIAQTAYNVADAIWVSGLGPDSLAAIGFFFPIYFILMSLAGGIGVGASSAISRKIGAKDKASADKIAIQSIVLSFIASLIISIPVLPFLETIIRNLGAKNISFLTTQYGRVILAGTIFLFFSNISNAILRGEGDTKKAMWAMVSGSILNIILDPMFIYVLKLGVVGAALASILSMALVSALFIYWLFFQKKTFVSIHFNEFKFTKEILREIFSVGIPSSMIQMGNAFSMFFINLIAIKAGGTDGVAVFTSGWRIVMIGTLPMIGMSMGVTAVTGAAYGAKEYKKLKTAYFYAIRTGLIIEVIAGILLFTFAKPVSFIFTYAPETRRISEDLIHFLKVMCAFYPFIPLGMLTSAMFQGIRRGFLALIITLTRTILLNVPLAYILSIVIKLGSSGVWWGIVLGNATAGLLSLTIATIIMHKCRKNIEICS